MGVKTKPVAALVRLVLSLAVLAMVFELVGGARIVEALGSVRPVPWAAVLLGFLTLHVASAIKWRYFLGLFGAKVPFVPTLQCYSAGLFGNLCLPSLVGGDVLRAGLAMRFTPKKEAVVLSTAIERLSDVVALLILTVLGMIAAPSAVGELEARAALGFAVLLACVLIAAWAATKIPLRRMPRRLARFSIQALRSYRAAVRSPAKVLAGTLICVALQAGFVLLNVQLGEMIGMHLDIALWFSLWPLSKIASMLPISLGGLGVREAAFGLLVKPFIDSRLAVAESLIWQTILVAGGLIAGAYWLASGLRTPSAT
jgi:glycosyltransferase 2 family protein